MNKNIRVIVNKSIISSIANIIRNKIKSIDEIYLKNVVNNINNIVPLNTMNATANTKDIVEGKIAYVNGKKIIGVSPFIEQTIPNIAIDNNGLIITTVIRSQGCINSSGTKISTKQLAFQPAITITPSNVDQIVASKGTYVGGNITVKGDSNLTAENIKSGINIFGITGNYNGEEGEGEDIEKSFIDRTITSYTNNKVTTIGISAFAYCKNLSTVSFPTCTIISGYAFRECKNLLTANFPVCTSIDIYAFYSCNNLYQIYLMSSTVCSLYDTFVFSNTSIWSNKGSIFVPASLVNSYKTATNWTFFSNRIFGV